MTPDNRKDVTPMPDLHDYEVPDDLDIAAVLSLFLLERDGTVDIFEDPPATLANPVTAQATMKEVRAVYVLQCIDCILTGFAVRAGAQIIELCASVEGARDELVRNITSRMSEIDQRRMALLGYGTSMASPFQLGPPDSLLPRLLDYMQRWPAARD
jgi:hypothetical protein